MTVIDVINSFKAKLGEEFHGIAIKAEEAKAGVADVAAKLSTVQTVEEAKQLAAELNSHVQRIANASMAAKKAGDAMYGRSSMETAT